MLKNRAIRLSLKNRIQTMFEAPEAGSGLAAFNVYTEAQFRQASLGKFTPVFPYIYLLDSFMPPVAQREDVCQPQIVIEIDSYAAMPFELGNRSGRSITALIHVFGQNRGQRDDYGSYIMDYIGNALSIYDYSAAVPSGTLVETAIIDSEKILEDIWTARLDLLLAGAMTWGHSRLTLSFKPKL